MVTTRNFRKPAPADFVHPSILDLLTEISASFATAGDILNKTPQGFRILVNASGRLAGILDHKKFTSELLKVRDMNAPLSRAQFSVSTCIRTEDSLPKALNALLSCNEDVVPICDGDGYAVNAITRQAFLQWLTEDRAWDPYTDFLSLHGEVGLQNAVLRPWGFYRVLLRNGFSQTKILALEPGQEISLQKHFQREEYWTIVHGGGVFRLGDEFFPVSKGFTARIPRGAVHWLRNTGTREKLVILEVQTGDAFREDDIVRLSDRYHRV